MSTVNIDHIYKSFGDVEVLKDFNYEVQDGEFITLLGPSGCGKTTMLRIIAGFEKPTKGRLFIGDKEVSSDDVFLPPEKRGIGMVFQSYAVWPHMNVFDNVAYPLKIQKMPKKEIKKKVDNILKVVHLSQYADRMPSQLSGGQQQRIALGRALVAEPSLLLLDEPLSNLDAKLREKMRYEIKEIQKNLNITVIFVTHDQVEAMTMSDKVVVLNAGVVQQIGSPYEIYSKPANQFVADFVGKVNFLEGEIREGKVYLKHDDRSIPIETPKDMNGEVILGIRPEDVRVAEEDEKGLYKGKIRNMYFLGEENDTFVEFNNQEFRITIPSYMYGRYDEGDEVEFDIKHVMVFPKEEGKDYSKILT